jgi:mono/diheme cytochrome c family protein
MSLGAALRTSRVAVAAASAGIAAAAISGCGGTSGGTSGGASVSGHAVFADHCEICHSIAGSSTPEQQGGDLRGLRLPRNELVQFTVEMPVIHRRLSAAEVQAVVNYMQSKARH